MFLDRKILSLIDLYLQERLEQVIVRASSSEHKKQLAMFHTVDQQPITFKVNFSVSFPASLQCMVAIAGAQLVTVLPHQSFDSSASFAAS